MTQTVRRFDYTDVGHNIARGILPVVSDFDTPPPTPANMTDGNLSIDSGTGITTTGAATTVGYINLDFERSVNVLCMVYLRAWSDTSDFSIIPQSSENGVNYRRGGVSINTGWHNSDPGVIMPAISFSHSGRYLQLYCYATGAGTHSIVIHEIIALGILP